MLTLTTLPVRRTLLLAATLLTACSDAAPVQPLLPEAPSTQQSAAAGNAAYRQAIATLRRVTDRYHNIDVARADGFVLLHECETRPGEGPVGIVYVHMGRLVDGKIDASLPEALIYEPRGGQKPRLVGVEFAMPYALWQEPRAPRFLGVEFQPEDEFGVFALHAWVWRENPDGMFAETNPRVRCAE